MYTFLIVALSIIVIASALIFFVRRRSAKSGSSSLPSMTMEDMIPVSPPPLDTPAQYFLTSSERTSPPPLDTPAQYLTSSERIAPQQAGYGPKYSGYWDDRAYQTPGSTSYKEPLPGHNNVQRYPNASVHPHSLSEFSPRTPANSAYDKNPLHELEKEYERGMQATYDEYLDVIHLVITNVVMKTPAEVTLAFQVCTRKIQAVLWPRGMQRSGLLVDIAGLVIGGDATTTWGQSLKTCWDKICVVVEKDRYLAAHYNSRASSPSKEQLQEKIRRIQIMTAAVLNDFQSNIFDTREEAIAFLQRMRELSRL